MQTKGWINRLQERLHTDYLGRMIAFSREVSSTNAWAKKLAVTGACEGTVVIAETQKNGRGRLEREWISPSGGLWFSLILRPKLHPAEAVKLTFLAGLAVADVLKETFALKPEIKWPNDLLVDKQKICGILTEMNSTEDTATFAVVGIGINANFDVEEVLPTQLVKSATSLENELGRKVRLEELFISLLERLERLYELFLEEGFSPILEKWKSYAGFIGCKVRVQNQSGDFVGLAMDVDLDGSLVIKLEDGTSKRVFVGDISLQVQ